MTLTEIEYGSLASSATLNGNFQYLQDKITELSALITSETSSYSSTVSTLNNSITTLLSYKNSFIPTGTIIATQNATIPIGFLFCDGSELLVADYEALYAVIGATYGQSDSTKFKLPDLRGITLFGKSDSNTLGATLSASLPNIKGNVVTDDYYWENHITDMSGAFYATGKYSSSGLSRSSNTNSGTPQILGFDASKASSVYSDNATTVQPPALVTNFVIKY